MRKCAIIMYHYVRELQYTRYPSIKGLKTSLFKEQLAYMRKYYNFVRHTDLLDAICKGKELPPNAAWLTFDDAYLDHYNNVFPILDDLGIQGGFFAPVKAVTKHEVLDVNKIHFILASGVGTQNLLKDIFSLLAKNKEEYLLESGDYYYKKLAKANRFDNADVIFIKRLLQVELPEKLRRIITNTLFKKYVSNDEESFSRELYMNTDQMKCMIRHGMYIGSHGFDHYWLNSLSPERQAQEIDKSLEFLKNIGSDVDNWIMNYPYGGYNDSLINIIKQKGCKFAVTTNVNTADFDIDNIYTLPRLDTNDIPIDRNATFKETL